MTSTRSRLTRRSVAAGLLAAPALLGRAEAQALSFRYANASTDQNITNQFIIRFAKEVEKRSEGQIRITTLFNAGAEQSIVEGVSLGTLDMAISGYTGLREFDVLYTPYLLRDIPHGVKVFDGPIGQKCAAALDARYKARLIGVGSTGPFLLSVKKKISSWGELKGLKIRVPPFESYADAVRALAAVPTPVPFNEVYLALQQGVADGLITNLNVMIVNHFYEACTNVITNDFGVGLDKFIMSNRAWGRMSEKQREMFMATWKELSPEGVVYGPIENAKRDFETWKKRNGDGSVFPLDQAEVDKILGPLGEKLANEVFGAGSYAQIKAA